MRVGLRVFNSPPFPVTRWALSDGPNALREPKALCTRILRRLPCVSGRSGRWWGDCCCSGGVCFSCCSLPHVRLLFAVSLFSFLLLFFVLLLTIFFSYTFSLCLSFTTLYLPLFRNSLLHLFTCCLSFSPFLSLPSDPFCFIVLFTSHHQNILFFFSLLTFFARFTL